VAFIFPELGVPCLIESTDLSTALIPNEKSTKRRDFGTFPSITPSCTAHESLEMPPNATARCSDTSST
jgi:hypothetical protein